jgi:hypothetical protein
MYMSGHCIATVLHATILFTKQDAINSETLYDLSFLIVEAFLAVPYNWRYVNEK